MLLESPGLSTCSPRVATRTDMATSALAGLRAAASQMSVIFGKSRFTFGRKASTTCCISGCCGTGPDLDLFESTRCRRVHTTRHSPRNQTFVPLGPRTWKGFEPCRLSMTTCPTSPGRRTSHPTSPGANCTRSSNPTPRQSDETLRVSRPVVALSCESVLASGPRHLDSSVPGATASSPEETTSAGPASEPLCVAAPSSDADAITTRGQTI
mmetsp:Transcript_29437/g.80502  ORF Transcript_29437/g.80502 Transcript_29437/m.80502 type:complete len:211 (+) Transcript_29437:529-1161(+)